MKHTITRLALSAALASILAACGGGSDAPDSSGLASSFTITGATVASLNGVYGSTATGVSDVNKLNDIGGDKCDFSFNNVSSASAPPVSVSGNVQYDENAPTLAISTSFNVGGAGYVFAAGGTDTSVDRAGNRVTFTNKLFKSAGTGTDTFSVTGYLPMKSNRPSGC